MKSAPEQYRLTPELAEQNPNLNLVLFKSTAEYGNNGCFLVPKMGKADGWYYLCIVSDGRGWEHVSVTILDEKRTPSWEEMCYIKNIFWAAQESVVQFHPPATEYVNNHRYCLHLWMPTTVNIPSPPSILVGLTWKK